MAILHAVFAYGRFHRDFNLPKSATNLRYHKRMNSDRPMRLPLWIGMEQQIDRVISAAEDAFNLWKNNSDIEK